MSSYCKEVYLNRIYLPLVELIQSGISAEKLSLSLAFGLTCGVFPVPGFTTVPLILLIYVFQLNPVAAMLINVLSTPLNLASAPVFIHYGRQYFGPTTPRDQPLQPLLSVPELVADLRSDPFSTLETFRQLVGHGVLLWCCWLPFATASLVLMLWPVIQRLVTAVSRKKTR